MWFRILAALFSVAVAAPSFAQVAKSEPVKPDLILEFPVFDLPYNMTGGGWIFPSMRQSLELSTSFYQGVHYAIAQDEEPTFWRRLAISGVDLLTLSFPLSSSWLHEEWHRAVLGHRGIGSFNDVYNFPIGASVIAVSHVADEELVRLKRDYPADQVRLGEAGMEAQFEQNLLLERRRFFYETKSYDKIVLLINHLNNIFYLHTCANGSSADATTSEQNREDGTDLPRRDFTGLDCTGWAYDLFRPDEPYTARGTHPSGVGINRYRKFSDLNGQEQEFLRLQAWLSLVNLVDPFLIDIDSMPADFIAPGARWNFTLRHQLTSFGYSLEGNVFVKSGDFNWLFQVQNFLNTVRYFPGLSAELSRYPLHGTKLLFTGRANAWMQPEGQRYNSTVSVPGARLSAQLGYPVSRAVELNAGLEGKTEGWVAGNVYLERNFSAWGGATILF